MSQTQKHKVTLWSTFNFTTSINKESTKSYLEIQEKSNVRKKR